MTEIREGEGYGRVDGNEGRPFSAFPIGKKNDVFAQYLIGQSYFAPISTEQILVFNVIFEPACRNHWHIRHVKSGGGQMLFCISGRVVSGMGRSGTGDVSRRRCAQYSCRCKTLTQCFKGFMVPAPCVRSSRRGGFDGMVRGCEG